MQETIKPLLHIASDCDNPWDSTTCQTTSMKIEHDQLLAQIDEQPWLDDLKRRVQHYGFKYDYKARRVARDMRIGKLPKWLEELAEKLWIDGHMPEVADQVIVNEYEPQQGISRHIDCETLFSGYDCFIKFGDRAVLWILQTNLIREKKYLFGLHQKVLSS